VGGKYPRDELIAAILFPSAKISSGYEPSTFALLDGRVITGIVRNETASSVEVQDAEAKSIRIAKADVDERKRSDVSLMPNGLAQGLSPQDFADLIAYLETLKNTK
jgi:putative heme-binding domain-containing protein